MDVIIFVLLVALVVAVGMLVQKVDIITKKVAAMHSDKEMAEWVHSEAVDGWLASQEAHLELEKAILDANSGVVGHGE